MPVPPVASIVVPAYNAAATIAETLNSLLAQTFVDLEIIVVDDGSSDDTAAIVGRCGDPRVRLLCQANRGLAGAHNTGIAAARGRFIGFCDADDLWMPEKLERHVRHLEARPDVGISFSGSRMIDAAGRPLGIDQKPRLRNITPALVFKRNPIGNGSAAVMRREALDGMRFRPAGETERDWWFDERFRQSDDIEGWMRFCLTQDWRIEGIPGLLTLYRIHTGGLSSNVAVQFATWMRMHDKVAAIAPHVVARHGAAATAYQFRYLCRRAVSIGDGKLAGELARRSLKASLRPLVEEPLKTVITVAAAHALALFGPHLYRRAERRVLRPRAA